MTLGNNIPKTDSLHQFVNLYLEEILSKVKSQTKAKIMISAQNAYVNFF